MANVLTNLAADIYKAADMVGRELVGFIPSVTINGDATTRAAKGDTIRSFVTRAVTVSSSFAPSMTIPEGTDQTIDTKTMTLDTYASVQIPWTGEDMKHVNNGNGFETIYGDQIRQAIRAICNTVETSVWQTAYKGASRAIGTAGTTPFATTHNDLASLRKILADNGCPMDGQVTLAMNTAAGVNMRNLTQLQKANEAGGTELLRQGTLLDLQGIMVKESAAPVALTAGTGASYVTSGSTAAGVTDIALVTGTGTVLAGDVVTFAADSTNKYVVNTGVTAPGTISLGAPGARVVIATANALTVGSAYTPNMAFHRSAIELGIRAPAMPNGGDAAVDLMTVQDPHSGLVFEIAAYKGYMKSMFEVRCVYGSKAWKSNHIATLMG
ncbi:P22 coat - protein 5 family protein [Variovorax paradoxus]|nr:P22 coat - protein 5 family protein [Variovorax paradoxus]